MFMYICFVAVVTMVYSMVKVLIVWLYVLLWPVY